MSETVNVLVLCNGNIGRSPLAAALLQQALAAELQVEVAGLSAAGITVDSAGIEAPEGHAASMRGQAFAAPLGIDLSTHSAKLLTAEMVEAADVIYAMDRAQLDGVGRLVSGGERKVLLWEGEESEIPDPHHEDDRFFVDIGHRIVAAVPERMREVLRIRSMAPAGPGDPGSG